MSILLFMLMVSVYTNFGRLKNKELSVSALSVQVATV